MGRNLLLSGKGWGDGISMDRLDRLMGVIEEAEATWAEGQ